MRYLKSLGFILGFLFGAGLALAALVTGSIGPEPPRTWIGELLAIIFRPVAELVLGLAGWPAGLVILVIASGLQLGCCGRVGIGLVTKPSRPGDRH